jgi:hypothetical protein
VIITRRFWVCNVAPPKRTRTKSGSLSRIRQALAVDVRTDSSVGALQAQANAEEFGKRKLRTDHVFVTIIEEPSGKANYSLGPRYQARHLGKGKVQS